MNNTVIIRASFDFVIQIHLDLVLANIFVSCYHILLLCLLFSGGEGGETYYFRHSCLSVHHKTLNVQLLHFKWDVLKTLQACLLPYEDSYIITAV